MGLKWTGCSDETIGKIGEWRLILTGNRCPAISILYSVPSWLTKLDDTMSLVPSSNRFSI